MKPVERQILQALTHHAKPVDGQKLSELSGVPYSSLMSVLSSLEADGLAKVERSEEKSLSLTDEGRDFSGKGLPERRLLNVLSSKPMPMAEAFQKAGLKKDEEKIALLWAKKNGWIAIEQGAFVKKRDDQSVAEKELKALAAGSAQKAPELLARKLATQKGEKSVSIQITATGKKALFESGDVITQLTPEMLKTGSWKGKKFQSYDLDTLVAPVNVGKKHAYQEFLNRIRDQLVGLGFREVNDSLVEMEFWNMDALFMAQDHPARDIHDVFFLKEPSRGAVQDEALVQKVRTAHEEGLEGSKGWRYAWSAEIAHRLIARSHDTGISARALAASKNEKDRVFFITRVFRPDEIDWSHFIEFNQLGGYVAGPDITFSDLLGYLKSFGKAVFNAEDVKFAPSYFPFTEPSVELMAKIPGRGWAEVGGAGMFRPEMLRALGVNVPVIAWGLGVDRLAMLSLGITDIRELFSNDIAFLREGKKT